MIDKTRLNCVPFGHEPLALGYAQFADFQSCHAGFTIGQFCFRLACRAMLLNGQVVFRSETIPESQGARSAALNERAKPLASLATATAKPGRTPPVAIILGNEEEGLPAATLAACDDIVLIPGSGHVQSLNVAATAAILIHTLTARNG